MAVLKNRAKMSTSTTGTGTITLGSASTGFQSFADAGVVNADVVRYVIEDGNNWEIGTGTYSTATGTTLSRTVSESSNADAAINLSGSATVFIGFTAEDIGTFSGDISFEGATANDFQTTVTVTDPTADRTITLPDASGTVLLSDGDGSNLTGVQAASVNVTESADDDVDYNILFSDTGSYGTVQMTPTQDDGGLMFNPSTNKLENGGFIQAGPRADDHLIFQGYGGDKTSEYVAMGVQTGYASITAGGMSSTSTDLRIRTSNSGTEADRVTIKADGKTGIGTTSPSEALDVIGNIAVSGTVDGRDIATNIPSSLGTAGQVLTVNSGASAAEWAAASGGADLYAANESSPTAQPSATGSNAIAIGDSSVSGGTNSFSGPNSRAAGAESVAIGISSNSSFSGASNSGGVAIGRYANSTGVDSISLGRGTNSTAQQTLALGYEATASNTQAVAIQASRSTGTNSLAIQTEGPNFYGATASYSIAIGRRAQSNGSYSVAIGGFTPIAGSFGAISLGYETVSNGTYATVLGNRSTATAQSSVALGTYANSDIQGKLAYSSERFGLTGDSQAGLFVLRCDTTDATPEKLQTTAGTQSVGSTNQVVLPNDSVFGFTGTVIARENSSQTDDFAVWEIKGGAVRGANAASTTLGSYNINKISESAGATNWSIALSADTTNGAVSITVTGEASHSIRWVATINTTEVTY